MFSEKAFRALFESALDAIVILDNDRRFVEVNSAACALFGRPRGDLLGRRVAEITPPGFDTEKIWQLFRDAGQLAGEWRIARPDGSFRELEFTARADFIPGHHLSALRDITDRKRLESELRTSEVHLSEGQRLSNTGSWVWTVATGEVLWSKEAFRIFGLDPDAARGSMSTFMERLHPEDQPAVRREMERAGREKGCFDLFYRVLRPDGTVRYVHSRGRPVLDGNGEFVQFLGAVTDVTERRLSEERLQQSSEELRALSERLRVVREEEGARIAREVHDEIGQSLTALQMDLAWLSRRAAALPDPAADQVAAKLQSMSGLLDKTLDAVQRIATELRPGVLDELGLEAAVDWYVREFERRASVPCRLRCDLEGHRVSAGLATAVFRILQEALTNVWRHSGATRTDVHLSIDGAQLCLAIEDNGQGVAAERVADFRSLGLLGMQERARALGGSVAIRGVPGRGTRVAVTIPV